MPVNIRIRTRVLQIKLIVDLLSFVDSAAPFKITAIAKTKPSRTQSWAQKKENSFKIAPKFQIGSIGYNLYTVILLRTLLSQLLMFVFSCTRRM